MAKSQSLLRPLGLATTLFLGFAVVWTLLVAWIGSMVAEMWRPDYRSEQLMVQTDGTPVIQTSEYHRHQWNPRTYRDLDGKPVEPSSTESWMTGGYLDGPRRAEGLLSTLSWDNRIRKFWDIQQHSPAVWYFMHDGRPDGRGYFVGYDIASKSRFGFIGRSGFREGPLPPDEHFPVRTELMAKPNLFWSPHAASPTVYYSPLTGTADLPGSMVFFFPSGNRLYEVDLRARQVRIALENATPITGVSGSVHAEERGFRFSLAVRTEDRIRILSGKRAMVSEIVLPPEVSRELITWYELGQGRSLVQAYERIPSGYKTVLYWISRDGAVEQKRDVELQRAAPSPSWTQMAGVGLTLPSPVPLAAGTLLGPLLQVQNGQEPDYSTALSKMVSEFWPVLAIVFFSGALCAGWCHRRERRYAATPQRRLAWTAFVFLFGVPALAGYLLHRRWPVLAPCPACAAAAPRDDDHCARCGTPFPEPARKGIEVFA